MNETIFVRTHANEPWVERWGAVSEGKRLGVPWRMGCWVMIDLREDRWQEAGAERAIALVEQCRALGVPWALGVILHPPINWLLDRAAWKVRGAQFREILWKLRAHFPVRRLFIDWEHYDKRPGSGPPKVSEENRRRLIDVMEPVLMWLDGIKVLGMPCTARSDGHGGGWVQLAELFGAVGWVDESGLDFSRELVRGDLVPGTEAGDKRLAWWWEWFDWNAKVNTAAKRQFWHGINSSALEHVGGDLAWLRPASCWPIWIKPDQKGFLSNEWVDRAVAHRAERVEDGE